MDIMETIPFDSLPVFFQVALYACAVCLALVLVGLCIVALLFTLTAIRTWLEDFIDDMKKDGE